MSTKKYKLKTTFDDFYVEEQLDYNLTNTGSYYLFNMDKSGLDTLGALRITSKRLNIPRKKIGYSGLKDRYSHSRQYITIPKSEIKSKKDPQNLEFTGPSLVLRYIGEVEKQLRLGTHHSNFFRITIRKLTAATFEQLKNNLNVFSSGCPVPNYFDSQKFGLLGGPGGFFAPLYLKGEYEAALKSVIARPNRKERPRSKEIHKYLQENWGNWKQCNEYLENNRFENYLKITTFLHQNSSDYPGAIKLITKDILKMKITAFQAFLWNEYLKKLLSRNFEENELEEIKYHVGRLLFLRNPDQINKLSNIFKETMPLPSYDLGDDYTGNYNSLLQEHFDIRDVTAFKKFRELKYITNAFERKMFFKADNLTVEEQGRDSRINKEKNRYSTISFSLPPGSYATVLIKAVLLA